MNKLLPSPLLSVSLILVWLLLNQSLALSQLLLGGLLAWVIPMYCAPLAIKGSRIRKPWVLFRLLAWSATEIVRSCINVSRIILFRRQHQLNSQFIRVPLHLRDVTGLAVLSCIINSTPGTVWVEILPDTHELSLHVFDLHDEAWWIDTIKQRYEQPLIEIFEGASQ
ncbi:Na+/H+ antiporter subunit E [Alishewanella sp. 16-MA]|uniref:Na+/H+ antiporter subunit E n=1 Tax=Alishewanella maricola TaxID=2795740 RepID=A0ABS8C523_9ALTE|nr:Na+/H+ antiporter subunit E [Alishewanella maricola]MCB5227444.1 Na+/H+ antiporter subunit E [Alishewanella maricola]